MKNESFLGAFGGNFFVGVVLPALLLLTVVYFIWAKEPYTRDA